MQRFFILFPLLLALVASAAAVAPSNGNAVASQRNHLRRRLHDCHDGTGTECGEDETENNTDGTEVESEPMFPRIRNGIEMAQNVMETPAVQAARTAWNVVSFLIEAGQAAVELSGTVLGGGGGGGGKR